MFIRDFNDFLLALETYKTEKNIPSLGVEKREENPARIQLQIRDENWKQNLQDILNFCFTYQNNSLYTSYCLFYSPPPTFSECRNSFILESCRALNISVESWKPRLLVCSSHPSVTYIWIWGSYEANFQEIPIAERSYKSNYVKSCRYLLTKPNINLINLPSLFISQLNFTHVFNFYC